MNFNQIVTTLTSRFSEAILSTDKFRDEHTFMVKPQFIKDVCLCLKDDLGFDLCSDICGADRFTDDDRFEVVYNLFNTGEKIRIRLKVRVDESDPHVPSVVSVWESADWYERETYDMYGIVFEGHPDLRRIYMPEDFEYYPLRKEFPLIGIPGSIPLPEIEKAAQHKDAGEAYNNQERI